MWILRLGRRTRKIENGPLSAIEADYNDLQRDGERE
jgi:hypothetical protein